MRLGEILQGRRGRQLDSLMTGQVALRGGLRGRGRIKIKEEERFVNKRKLKKAIEIETETCNHKRIES